MTMARKRQLIRKLCQLQEALTKIMAIATSVKSKRMA